MVITQPTVDDFSDTTVMRVIRKIVNYICSDSGLVAQINDNDITGFTSSYTGNVLKIDATKGDGTIIPVCNLTIEGGSSTGNPYPTEISGTVGADGNITFTVTMSSGSPLTTTINMNYFASAAELSDLHEQVTGLKLSTSNNNMTLNGDSVQIVKNVTGNIDGNNLTIDVNGVTSLPIMLPNNGGSIQIKEYTNVTLESMLNEWYEDEENGDTFVFTTVFGSETDGNTATNIIITITNKKVESSITHNYRVITGYLTDISSREFKTNLTNASNKENDPNFRISYLDTQDNTQYFSNFNTDNIISGILYRIR